MAERVRRILALCRCRTLAKNSNIVMINTTGKMPVLLKPENRQSGIPRLADWIPASVGMTNVGSGLPVAFSAALCAGTYQST
jgi:hypothetical protein